MAQCTAKSKQSGERCRAQAIAGGNVCKTHGGSAPQVKKAAKDRLAALVDPAIGVMRDSLKKKADPRIRLLAAKDILDRNGYKAPDKHVFPEGVPVTLDADPLAELVSRIAGLKPHRS